MTPERSKEKQKKEPVPDFKPPAFVQAAKIASQMGRVSRLLAYRQADRASQFFGVERFEEFLKKHGAMDPNELVQATEAFRGELESEEIADLEAVKSFRERGALPKWVDEPPPKRGFPIYYLVPVRQETKVARDRKRGGK